MCLFFAVWAGVVFFFAVWAGCVFFFLLFGRGACSFFAVWAVAFFLFGPGACYFLLFGRGMGVHSLTRLPGSSLSDPTTKETEQQNKNTGSCLAFKVRETYVVSRLLIGTTGVTAWLTWVIKV